MKILTKEQRKLQYGERIRPKKSSRVKPPKTSSIRPPVICVGEANGKTSIFRLAKDADPNWINRKFPKTQVKENDNGAHHQLS